MGEDGALRADAERNRQAIVAAARTAFAEAGTEVSIAEIARRAGVGFATVQRRFPTKSALVAEVVAAQLAELRVVDEGSPGEGGGLPSDGDGSWETFAGPIRACCAHQASEPGLADAFARVLEAASEAHGSDPTVREPVAALFEHLAAGARASGHLRPDVTLDDVLLLVKANAGVVANSPGNEAEASRRFVDLALEGLRGGEPGAAQGRGRGGGGPT